MFFELDDGVADDGMNALVQLVQVLDERRSRIDRALEGVVEECPFHDDADDLAGLGFVACQRYMTEVAAQLRVRRTDALARGPRTRSGETVAGLIDAAANAWKHEAEWQEPLDRRQRCTAERLAVDLPNHGWDYKYVNALSVVAADSRFITVAGLLVAWRDDVRGQAAPTTPPGG